MVLDGKHVRRISQVQSAGFRHTLRPVVPILRARKAPTVEPSALPRVVAKFRAQVDQLGRDLALRGVGQVQRVLGVGVDAVEEHPVAPADLNVVDKADALHPAALEPRVAGDAHQKVCPALGAQRVAVEDEHAQGGVDSQGRGQDEATARPDAVVGEIDLLSAAGAAGSSDQVVRR